MAKKAKKIKKGRRNELMEVNPDAAGIDIASTEYQVCVPEDRAEDNNRRFDCFTCDLHKIAKWLKECGVKTVAMESTGIYWIQLFLTLQSYGFEVLLVNAKHIKNIGEKKTDEVDAEWIMLLHRYGLLKPSYQLDNNCRAIRNLVRQREELVRQASREVQHIQKALEQMNIKLHKVISDIVGKSGILMIEAILGGERNAENLASLADVRIKASKQDIIKSLEANWSEDQLFLLEQSYEAYQFQQQQLLKCDQRVEKMLSSYSTAHSEPKEFTRTTKKQNKKNMVCFDVEKHCQSIFGVNILMIPGINGVGSLKLASELGKGFTDKFETSSQFCSWTNTVPNNKITGGKIIASYVPKKKNVVGQVLRQAATTLKNSKCPLGNYFRRIQSREGFSYAVVATAHKIARILYAMVKNQVEFDDRIDLDKQKTFLNKKLSSLRRTIKTLENQLELVA